MDFAGHSCCACSHVPLRICQQRLAHHLLAGIDSGMTLSAGEVAPASKEHPGAELFVEVLVQPHPLFERAGNDVVLPHHLDMVDAALGTEIT